MRLLFSGKTENEEWSKVFGIWRIEYGI
ncbi:hypothetical protein SCB49_11964 [unidentified eubacterium SCB49]|nr:hypothetical protein SCB49_11964 [unidentified eubacterium SCB49]